MSAATAALDHRAPAVLPAAALRPPVVELRAARGFVPIMRSEFDAYAAEKALDFDEENLLHRLLGHAHWTDGTVRGGYTHLAGLWRMGPSGRRRLARLIGRLAEKAVVEVVPDTGRDDGCVRVVDYAQLVANGATRGRAGNAQPLVPKRAAGRAGLARPASHNASGEEEQVEEPPYPPPAEDPETAPPRPRTAGGNGHLENPGTAGADRPAELAGAVFEGFRQPVPPARRAAYDRQIAGPGGQRLVAAATSWLAHGGSLMALVDRAAAGPQPSLVHNWPAFFAARLEGLDPPGEAPPEDLEPGGAAAAIDVETARRRAEDDAARAELAAAEAEALAVSGALDDDRLAAVVGRVGERLAGPLARSPLALARAVVVWCRAAAAQSQGPFLAAVDAALAEAGQRTVGDELVLPLLELPAAPRGTPTLRERVAGLVRTTAGDAP
jgi:hypothetical protein